MEQRNKEEKKTENSATNEIEIKTTCQKSCKICYSNNRDKIHALKKEGKQGKEIVEFCLQNFNEQISESSLSRHFQNYQKNINAISAEIISKDMLEQATMQSVHLVKVVELIDLALKTVRERMIANSYKTDVADLEKLMNMRYKLLSGESDGDDLVALFQKASEQYGYQESLFVARKRSVEPSELPAE